MRTRDLGSIKFPLALCIIASTLGAGGACAATLTVGAGQAYATLGDAVAAAQPGDTIDILAGTYADPDVTVNVPLTITGVGGPVVFTSASQLQNDMAYIVADADLTVQNITFENAVADPSSNNGAGIRYQSGNLVVQNSAFIGDQDGILGSPATADSGSVTITGSTFQGNGAGDGYSHALYIGDVAMLTVTGSDFQGTQVGHDIKSRAADSVIQDNTLDDGVTGTASYAIDLPNGGDATITGNAIDQGPDTSNWNMLAYGEEGIAWAVNNVLIQDNSFINTDPDGSVGVADFALPTDPTDVTVTGNLFQGVQQPIVSVYGATVNASGNVLVSEPPATFLAALGLLAAPLAGRARRRGGVRGRIP